MFKFGTDMIRARSILLLSLVLITQCNQKEEEPGLTGEFPAFEFSPGPNTIYGEWEDHSVFMYSANFKFNTDGTFDFRDRGCTGGSCSKGKWTTDNGMIVVTSFDEYKKSDEPYSPPVVIGKENPSKKNTYKTVIYTLDTSFYQELRYNRDSVPLYFDKRKFILRGDTLYGVTQAEKYVRR